MKCVENFALSSELFASRKAITFCLVVDADQSLEYYDYGLIALAVPGLECPLHVDWVINFSSIKPFQRRE